LEIISLHGLNPDSSAGFSQAKLSIQKEKKLADPMLGHAGD
jgi:hypothetical protein